MQSSGNFNYASLFVLCGSAPYVGYHTDDIWKICEDNIWKLISSLTGMTEFDWNDWHCMNASHVPVKCGNTFKISIGCF